MQNSNNMQCEIRLIELEPEEVGGWTKTTPHHFTVGLRSEKDSIACH